MLFAIKVILSAFIIAGVSELAKKASWTAAILASLPLTSLLSILWLYYETKDVPKIVSLSWGIFFAVIPSLLFFVALPFCLKSNVKFAPAFILSSLVTSFGYFAFMAFVSKIGVKI